MIIDSGANTQSKVAEVQKDNLPDLAPGVVALFGEPGTMKSTFACTWPKPVAFYDFDLGSHRVWGIKELVNKGRVRVDLFPLPQHSLTTRHERLEGFMATWQRFIKSFAEDCVNPAVVTIILDTSTMLWALIQDAYLEELQKAQKPGEAMRKQLLQIEFKEPNARMRSIFSMAKSNRKHLVLVHHETDEYAPLLFQGKPLLDERGQPRSAPTGKRIPDGFRYTMGLADWQFHVKLIQQGEPEKQTTVGEANILKSPYGIDLVGMRMTGLDSTGLSYMHLRRMLALLGRI